MGQIDPVSALVAVAAFILAAGAFWIQHRSSSPETRRVARNVMIPAGAVFLSALVVFTVALISTVAAQPPASPSAGPSHPPSTSPGRPASPTEELVRFEDFSGTELDPTKWNGAPAAAPHVAVVDQQLRVEVGASPTSGISTDVQSTFPRPADVVRFDMTLRRTDGLNDGGAHVYLHGDNGRYHEIWGGPNGDAVPTIGSAICETVAPCADYGDFTNRAELPARIGEPITVEVRSTGQAWEIEVDGRAWKVVDIEDGAIGGLTLGVYSRGAGFVVDIDNIFVRYAS